VFLENVRVHPVAVSITSQIPESLRYYIDYEKMARDMEMGGDVSPRRVIRRFISSGTNDGR
jgi:hypothetical protein